MRSPAASARVSTDFVSSGFRSWGATLAATSKARVCLTPGGALFGGALFGGMVMGAALFGGMVMGAPSSPGSTRSRLPVRAESALTCPRPSSVLVLFSGDVMRFDGQEAWV